MNDVAKCTSCGCELPADAPAGLCPKCLLAAGFESGPVGDPRDAATTPSPAAPALRFNAPSLDELNRRLPQYEFLELLGQGGMGAVYKARQKGLDRLVAVKILSGEISHDAAFAERFAREARALAKLSHPHIVAVYDFGKTEGARGEGRGASESPGSPLTPDPSPLFFIAMEYVDGVNLRQAIRAKSFTPEQALAVVPQICDALQFAHDEGVVHRDVKPENILVDKRGRVKIADFGLAKMLGGEFPDLNLTGTHQVMGTLKYMAPEQLEGAHHVDHRADIYSLGVVFYELLTGELPIGRFAPPSKKVQIDVRLDEVVLRALEKEPELRWQHAGDVKTQVDSIRAHQPERTTGRLAAAAAGATPVVSLPLMLVIATAMVMGLLSITAGLVMAGLAFEYTVPGSNEFWGMMGGAFGCVCGGAGSLAGAWNTYRQLRGHTSWMQLTHWSGFDAVVTAYGLAGLALLLTPGLLRAADALGPLDSPLSQATYHGAWLIGGLIVFQAAILLFYRAEFVWGSRYERRWIVRTTHEPRFSRTAIAGAAWAPCVLLFFAMFASTTLVSSRPDEIVMTPGGPMPVRRPDMPIGFMILAALVGLIGAAAPFATTILGFVSIAQIRRSEGRLYGLPLAVADALLFPLLLLDGVAFFAFVYAAQEIHDAVAAPGSRSLGALSLLIVALPILAWIDYRIVRAVWRSVSDSGPQLAGRPRSESAAEPVLTFDSPASVTRMRLPRLLAASLVVGVIVGIVTYWLASTQHPASPPAETKPVTK